MSLFTNLLQILSTFFLMAKVGDCEKPRGALSLWHLSLSPPSLLSHFLNLSLDLCFSLSEDEEKPNVEVIILVCTGAAATFLWLMLILFIRKLRKVGRRNRCRLVLLYSSFFLFTQKAKYVKGSKSR